MAQPPKIHPEGRITDPKYKGLTYERLMQKVAESGLIAENKALLTQFIADAALGKTILKGQKKKVGIGRLWKYLQDLQKLDEHLQKPLNEATQADMEGFILALENGALKSNRQKPFSPETQVTIKKVVVKFYKWLQGENRVAPEIVSWIDTSVKVKDYQALKKEQVELMVSLVSSNRAWKQIRNKALLMTLFDSGARVDEMMNVRLENISLENGNYRLRIEHSKTKPRTVSLPLCKELLDVWLDHHPARKERKAQLFPLTYAQISKIVARAGSLVGARLTPHGLRHSSVTYYANKLSRYQLCNRYGWAMSSKQPDRYIAQEGLDEEAVVEVVETDNVQKLKRENKDLNERLALLEEQFQRLFKKDAEELERIIELVKAGNNA